MKKEKYKYPGLGRPIKPTLSTVVQDIYNHMSLLITHIDNLSIDASEGKFIMNGKELPRFSDPYFDEMLISLLNNPESVKLLHEDKRIVETFPHLMSSIHSIKIGIMLGIIADRIKDTGKAEHVIRKNTQENVLKSILEQMSTLNTAKEELQERIKESKLTSEQLSDISKYKIKVSAYLKKEYPKYSITPNSLHKLPKKIQGEGRHFLREILGDGLQTDNVIKDIFRKPRESKRKYSNDSYGIGSVSKENEE